LEDFARNRRFQKLFPPRSVSAEALDGTITPAQLLPMNRPMQNYRPGKVQGEWKPPLGAFASCLLLLPFLSGGAAAQPIPGSPSDLWREPILPRGLALESSSQSTDVLSNVRGPSCRLFRMVSAYPYDPVGLESDNDTPANDGSAPGASNDREPAGEARLKVSLGSDNPYFDFRKPGDPGGVGFYRLHSQMLLFENQKTGLSMGLQAVTPAGLEADGVADGPTILSPNFAWFHEIGNGTAIQGFIGKNLRTNSRWSDSLERQINCGLALHRPIISPDNGPGQSVHLFLEALGRYRVDGDPALRPPFNWDILPGVHWRMGDNWWMSGGILMPLGVPRPDAHLWQITCSWQF